LLKSHHQIRFVMMKTKSLPILFVLVLVVARTQAGSGPAPKDPEALPPIESNHY
jgi:hypothetical protein